LFPSPACLPPRPVPIEEYLTSPPARITANHEAQTLRCSSAPPTVPQVYPRNTSVITTPFPLVFWFHLDPDNLFSYLLFSRLFGFYLDFFPRHYTLSFFHSSMLHSVVLLKCDPFFAPVDFSPSGVRCFCLVTWDEQRSTRPNVRNFSGSLPPRPFSPL